MELIKFDIHDIFTLIGGHYLNHIKSYCFKSEVVIIDVKVPHKMPVILIQICRWTPSFKQHDI
jgi:hypothetical protein